MRERILVLGATGAQGGSVARHLLRQGRVRVRAATRRPESTAARALERNGAEVVSLDLADRGSIRKALEGVTGVFGVTNYFEHLDDEFRLGIHLVDEVAAAGKPHLVLSTLPDVSAASGGILSVPHFDIKARLEDYARSLGLPATFVHVAFYYENFLTHFRPRPDAGGGFVFGFPQGDAPLGAVSVADIGGMVAAVLADVGGYAGAVLPLVGDERPAAAYAQLMTAELGITIRYAAVPREVFVTLPFPRARETADMFEYYRAFAPGQDAERLTTRALYPGTRDFAAWVRDERGALLAALEEAAAPALVGG